jgi:hypothetical protein
MKTPNFPTQCSKAGFWPSPLPLPHSQNGNSLRELTSGKSILKDLLKAQELQDTQIDGRVESEASLIRTESRVELDSIAAIDLWLSLVVLPDNTELNDPLGDGDDLESGPVFGVLFEEGGVLEG